MSCTICTKTKPIPQCSGILTLGTVAVADVQVVVTEIATNRQRLIDGTVAATVLTINLDDLGEFLSPYLLYNVQAYDTGVENFGTPLEITIDAVAYTCLNLAVSTIVNASTGVIEGAATFELLIEV